MTIPSPILDILLTPDHDAWRLYASARSWLPPMLRDHLDDDLEAFPVKEPDLEDLDKHMWSTDSPYEKRVTKHGGVELLARGRSAVTLAVWLEEMFLRERQE